MPERDWENDEVDYNDCYRQMIEGKMPIMICYHEGLEWRCAADPASGRVLKELGLAYESRGWYVLRSELNNYAKEHHQDKFYYQFLIEFAKPFKEREEKLKSLTKGKWDHAFKEAARSKKPVFLGKYSWGEGYSWRTETLYDSDFDRYFELFYVWAMPDGSLMETKYNKKDLPNAIPTKLYPLGTRAGKDSVPFSKVSMEFVVCSSLCRLRIECFSVEERVCPYRKSDECWLRLLTPLIYFKEAGKDVQA